MKMLKQYHVILTITTVCGLMSGYILTNYPPTALQKLLKWSKRKFAIEVMDTFRLTDVHRSGCLVKNEEFVAMTRNTLDECGMCENVERIAEYNLANDESVMDRSVSEEVTYSIHNELPIVVRNDTNNQDDDGIRVISDIAKDIGELKSTFIYKQCQYQSSLKARYAEVPHMLNYIATDGSLPFYAFWENCASRTIKEFRMFYHRPSYLSGSVQLAGSNWIFLCRNYSGKVYRQIELFSPFVMLLVQTGEMTIRLEAAADCVGMCDDLEKTLYTGDTLLFSANVYALYYKPVCIGHETIMIGVSGFIN